MIARIEISVDELFAQVIDQTLFDYKNNPDNGAVLAENMALSKNERDIFNINLRTAIDNIYSGMAAQINGFEYNGYRICAEININGNVSPDVVASRFKDLLKYAMLRWWHSTKSQSLADKYAADYDNLFSNLKTQLIGVVRKPYILY